MLQKQVFLMRVFGAVTATTSLLLLAGCGEQKTAKTIVAVKSEKPKIKNAAVLSNIAINPSFEESKVFDSGLYKKGKRPIKEPAGWITKGQILNNFTGWVSDEAHSGKRSLKIENIGGTNAYWEGKPIIFKEPVNSFEASIWTKTKEVKDKTGKGKFQLAFDVYLKDDNGKEVTKRVIIDIAKTDHNWTKTKKTFLRAMNIVKIVPYLYFSKMSGAIWFDDLDIVKKEIIRGKNVITNWNMEKGSNGKVNSWKANVEKRGVSALLWDDQGYKSNHSLKIANKNTSHNFWHQTIDLNPDEVSKHYVLQVYCKTKNIIKSPVVLIMFYKKDKTRILAKSGTFIAFSAGTHDWKKKILSINLKDKPEKVTILCMFYWSGTAWFDNLSLTPIYFRDSVTNE